MWVFRIVVTVFDLSGLSSHERAQKAIKMNEIKCDYCGKVYEFEDDGTVDCMPDGWILPTHEWICLDCGSCPECGKSLEKEPEKRGANPQLCRDCEENKNGG